MRNLIKQNAPKTNGSFREKRLTQLIEFFMRVYGKCKSGFGSNYIERRCLTLCIMETPKQVLWPTAKTQMKCRIMRHFIRVCTVC